MRLSVDVISGTVFVCFGTYVLLLAYRILPWRSIEEDPERVALAFRKFARFMRIFGPALIIFGILLLLGVFS